MTLVQNPSNYLVVRSSVEIVEHYSEYKETLQHDFWYSCAYCTIAEAEALGFGFEIEHYVPVALDSSLEHVYGNLMWSCVHCNDKKGSWSPRASAAAAGFMFFRPDLHDPTDHFEIHGIRIEGKTAIGRFSEKVLMLNRLCLRRVREIRQKLYHADSALQVGLRALVNLPIQAFPLDTRARILRAASDLQKKALAVDAQVSEEIARALAKSPLLERDPEEEEQTRGRREYLTSVQALHPGPWTARKRAAPRAREGESDGS